MFFNQTLDHVDHLAIAVLDLDSAVSYYAEQMGFKLDAIRETKGKFSGMRSAVMFSGEFSVVLLESLTEGSQIDRYLKRFGPGVQHVAFQVKDIHATYKAMTESGVKFSTEILEAPGLRQMFTKRDPNTGMMHEFIERVETCNFDEKNINKLFEQLEASGDF